MLPSADSYEELVARFRWDVPERYNIGVDVCDKWANREPDRLALVHKAPDGAVVEYTFGDVQQLSNQLANLLAARGVAARRPRRRPAAAGSRDRLRPRGGLQAGRDRGAAVHALRPRGPRVPPAEFRCEGGHHRRGGRGEARADPRRPARAPVGAQRRRAVRGLPRSPRRDRRPQRAVRAARHGGGGSGPPDLHLRDHGPAQGGAPRAAGAARPSAGGGDVSRPGAPDGRSLLDAGRLGVDRGPLRRVDAGVAPRRRRRVASLREVRPGAGLPADGRLRGSQRLPAAHRAEDDAHASSDPKCAGTTG